mmetsp:Transcript_66190/g.158318  ORF Transcript_66190/g.158318 Transcript_66190/m.158318 type:complete len:244 (+) Transcript_66190:103-834(+)
MTSLRDGPRHVAATLRMVGHESRVKAHGIKAGMRYGVRSLAGKCDDFFEGFCAPRQPSRERSPLRPQEPQRRDSTSSRQTSGSGDKGPLLPGNLATSDVSEAAQADFEQSWRLADVKVKKVRADGNCQFRALAVQIYGNEDRHAEVRKAVVQQLYANKEVYTPFLDEPFADYMASMAKPGNWGDHVTLQAAADWSQRKIIVLADDPAKGVTLHPRFCSKASASMKPIYLAYVSGVHYDAVSLP